MAEADVAPAVCDPFFGSTTSRAGIEPPSILIRAGIAAIETSIIEDCRPRGKFFFQPARSIDFEFRVRNGPIIGGLTGIQGQNRVQERRDGSLRRGGNERAAGLENILVSPLKRFRKRSRERASERRKERASVSPPRFLNWRFLQGRTKRLQEEKARQWWTESDPRRCIVAWPPSTPRTNFTPKRANKG